MKWDPNNNNKIIFDDKNKVFLLPTAQKNLRAHVVSTKSAILKEPSLFNHIKLS